MRAIIDYDSMRHFREERANMGTYTVNTHRKGKHTVTYECGHCRAPLESPLEEAGQTFACPTCGSKVETPGVVELERRPEAERGPQLQEQQLQEDARPKAAKWGAKAKTEAESRNLLGKEIAINPVRKWHLTVCHDLCLPAISVIVKQSGGNGKIGLFLGKRTKDSTLFIEGDFNGLLLGGTVGGEISTSCSVTIYVEGGNNESEYLRGLAHDCDTLGSS